MSSRLNLLMLRHCVAREVVLSIYFNFVYVVVNFYFSFYFSIVSAYGYMFANEFETKEYQKLTEINN